MAVFQPGDKIGNYRVVAKIKEGGMATLYLCERTGAAGFQKHVAVKVVNTALARDERFIEMFIDEAQLTSRIEHPNVVRVEELAEIGGTYFLVMEYVHGCSLSQLLRALARNRRRMLPELAVRIIAEASDGLHAAHEMCDAAGQFLNVVHRDVSPENILITRLGHVKLIDFGVAKFRDRVAQTTAGGTLKGKFAYMAPEQASHKPLDRRADIYQLGIVLWEMLTMRRCFKGEMSVEFLERIRNPKIEPPKNLAPGIEDALNDAVMKALEPNPDRRFETMWDFRKALVMAIPNALTLEAVQVADLLTAMVGDELQERDRMLAEDLTVASDVLDIDESQILKTLTIDDLNPAQAKDYGGESSPDAGSPSFARPDQETLDAGGSGGKRGARSAFGLAGSQPGSGASTQAADPMIASPEEESRTVLSDPPPAGSDHDATVMSRPDPSGGGEVSSEPGQPVSASPPAELFSRPAATVISARPPRPSSANRSLGALILAAFIAGGAGLFWWRESSKGDWALIKPKLEKQQRVVDGQ